MMNVLSTRAGPAATGSDLRLYDFANTYVSVSGMQATNVNIGELWVSYDVELLKPRLGAAADMADHYYNATGSGVTTSAYFGSTIPTVSSTSDLGTVLTNTTITFPASFTGTVLLSYRVTGNSTAVTAPTFTPSAGATTVTGLLGTGIQSVGSNGNTWVNLTYLGTFMCVGGGVLTLSGGTMPASPSAMDLLIVVTPSSLTN